MEEQRKKKLEWIDVGAIGRGSTAVVSLARAVGTGKLFAVKSAADGAALRREQRILASLNCPNIVAYLGHEFGSGEARIFMEYAPGGSISDEIGRRGGKLGEQEIRSRAGDILAGLAYLHARRLAHCDIKGRNVLIAADGRSVIADLGCTKPFGAGEHLGAGMRGTPMFMAPEVARGEEQGPEADIWAFGCTVIEMATGASPWRSSGDDDDDALAILHRIAFSDEVPETPEWFSDEARGFLGMCLARDPRSRATAEQLLEHPFVAKIQPSDSDPTARRASPKSILDRQIWDSMPEDEEIEEEEEIEEGGSMATDPSPRIGELSCPSGGADWTIDDGGDWITVRSIERSVEEDSCSRFAAADDEDDDEDEEAMRVAAGSLAALSDLRSGADDRTGGAAAAAFADGSSSGSTSAGGDVSGEQRGRDCCGDRRRDGEMLFPRSSSFSCALLVVKKKIIYGWKKKVFFFLQRNDTCPKHGSFEPRISQLSGFLAAAAGRHVTDGSASCLARDRWNELGAQRGAWRLRFCPSFEFKI